MKSLTKRTIRYGFRETGIWPVNSDKGLVKLGLLTKDDDLPNMPRFIIYNITSGTIPLLPLLSSLPNTPLATV